MKAAGLALVLPDGQALFLKRGPGKQWNGGTWCFPGGKVEAGEEPVEAALRETREETGWMPPADAWTGAEEMLRTDFHDIEYVTFRLRISNPFIPDLSDGEHVGWAWAPLKDPPQPLHPGMVDVLPAMDSAKQPEHVAVIRYDGDFDMAGLMRGLQVLGGWGSSRDVVVAADDLEMQQQLEDKGYHTKFNFDGDGSDKIWSVEVDGQHALDEAMLGANPGIMAVGKDQQPAMVTAPNASVPVAKVEKKPLKAKLTEDEEPEERPIVDMPRDRGGMVVEPDEMTPDTASMIEHNRERAANHWNYADELGAGNAHSYDKHGDYNCGRCNQADGDGCLLVDIKRIDRTAGSCEDWERITLGDAEMKLKRKSPDAANYGVAANGVGFGCHRCPFAKQAKNVDLEGRSLWCGEGGFHVTPTACCTMNGAETVPYEGAEDAVPDIKVDTDHDGPWMSCMSKDGGTMYRNRNMPAVTDIDGASIDVDDVLKRHEKPEWDELQRLLAAFKAEHGREPEGRERVELYEQAHEEAGVPGEREYFDATYGPERWDAWNAWCRGEEAKAEKGPFENEPADADVKPMPHGHGDLEFTGDAFDAIAAALDDWKESEHPRGQPGNAGQFGKGGGSSSKAGKPSSESGKSSSGALKVGELRLVGKQMGSNPGGVFEDKSGKRFYVKEGKSKEHVANELLAGALYNLAGSRTLDYHQVEGDKHIATAMTPLDKNNVNKFSAEEKKKAQRDFATHAWLANWDAAGLGGDNQGIVGGEPVSLDLGGALKFRGQGAPKGDKFGPSAGEWDTLRDASLNPDNAKLFAGMSPEQLKESAQRVADVKDADIRAAVAKSKFGPDFADKLIARKKDIAKRAGVAPQHKDQPAGDPSKEAAADPTKSDSVVSFSSDDPLPVKELNGVAFEPWHPPADWSTVSGQKDLGETEPKLPKGKTFSSGLIMREPDGRVWIVKPSGKFGGYKATFPKGGVEKGLAPQANAIKEVFEETGLKGRVTALAGDYEGDATVTRYYIAEREGGSPDQHKSETGAVVLAPPGKLKEMLNRSRDKKIAAEHLGDAVADERIGMDEKSARAFDADGRMHVGLCNISKAAVNPYNGSEIPGWRYLGLDPNKVYKLLRHPDELARAAPTFNRIQLLIKHNPVNANDHQPDKIVGTTGSDAVYEHPYLRNTLSIWTQDGIDAVQSNEKKELSSGYRYRPDMTPGTYEGQPYDGVMRDIRGNHVALVEEGRAGSDVVVADRNPKMSWDRLGRAIAWDVVERELSRFCKEREPA